MSKLRQLCDRLYIRAETLANAWAKRKEGRANARYMVENPRVAQEYHTTIRSYWRQFGRRAPRRFWYRLYCNTENPFDPGYIPDDWFTRDVIPYYNNLIFAKALQDKCLHSVLFPDIKRPDTLVKNVAGVFYDDDFHLLTSEEAAARCLHQGRILVKPSIFSGGGDNIRFFDSDELSKTDVEEIFRCYAQNFIIQKKMEQHPDLAALNPTSLNTVRLITFLHDNEVRVLTAILRVGGGSNEVDNTSQGGFKASVYPDGHLHRLGMTKLGGHWEYVEAYPNGVRFDNVVIPSYDRIKELVCAHAARMSHFKIIGWDMAVDPDGEPFLVEYNVIPAQGHGTDGPLFGDLTETVLAEVYGHKTTIGG